MIHVDAIQIYSFMDITRLDVRALQPHCYTLTGEVRWCDGSYRVGAAIQDEYLLFTTDRWEAIYEPREKNFRRWIPLTQVRGDFYPPSNIGEYR